MLTAISGTGLCDYIRDTDTNLFGAINACRFNLNYAVQYKKP